MYANLQKSFISNDTNKYLHYCNHLKYHIGIGGSESGSGNIDTDINEESYSEINSMFENLMNLIYQIYLSPSTCRKHNQSVDVLTDTKMHPIAFESVI